MSPICSKDYEQTEKTHIIIDGANVADRKGRARLEQAVAEAARIKKLTSTLANDY